MNPTYTPLEIQTALNLYRVEALQRREDAGHSGAHDDGGCGNMLRLADAYCDGRDNKAPTFLKEYLREARKQTDPEYQTFLALKKKFEP
jgi:hypothetical protein